MAWYLAPALAVGRAEVNRRWPKRDLASEGTVGDAAHQATRSDHNPNARESVDAWDMDVEVNGRGRPYAEDVEHLKRVFQAHEASRYWIHDDQIAERANDWRRRPYKPDDPDRNKHIKHVHWNTRQSMERSKVAWRVGDDEDLVAAQAKLLLDVQFLLCRAVPNPAGAGRVSLHVWASWLTGAVKSLAIATAGADEATKAQLRRDLDDLRAQVRPSSDDAIDAVRAADDLEDIVRRLREVLGDQATAVGTHLLNGS